MNYDSDILEWSEQQAALLRRVAAGERVNDVDWDNIIEEVTSVGREQLHAVESLLIQAMIHDLKTRCWPLSREVPHWRAEARRFRDGAARRFTPSMLQRLDISSLYRSAHRALPETIDGLPPHPVPAACPFTLDALLSED
ncbi:MAG: DUF29 domain-containing protein [Acetobacteraceae bacterium]|nr:DUF29 domain-containing protein [Acetobacteraceae bacterium]